ncbi:arsenic resistance protein [Acidimicrobiaceae bacterium AH-315-P05]|nr:arsenic resistance protein [Acidimicrobiaceae bacterium AH-315-P05]
MTDVDSTTEAPATLGRMDRYQPLLLIASIAAGLGLAKAAPGFANSLSPLVSMGVFVLIYLVMLGVDVDRIAAAFTQRRFLTIAVLINFVVNPLLAWGLGAVFLQDHPELRVGLILFLVTPCIGWYLIFTELAGGDIGLGVSLLGINLVLQVVLLPFYLLLFAGEASGVDLGSIVSSVGLFLVLPAALAAVTRNFANRSAVDLDDVQSAIGKAQLKTVCLVLVIVAMFASQADVIFDNPRVVITLLPPMVAFFVVAFGFALATGRAAGLPFDQTALLAFTTTSRNSEASLAIAATAFASPLVALTVVIGPVIELPFLVLMVRVLLGLRPDTDSTSHKHHLLKDSHQ